MTESLVQVVPLASGRDRILWGFFFFLIEVQLIYNVALVTGIQQGDSVLHIYVWILFSHSFLSYCNVVSIVPCAVLLVLVVYVFYTYLFVSANSKLLIYPAWLSPFITISLFSMPVVLSLFLKKVHLYHILNSTYKWYHMVFVFLFQTYFTQYDNL